MKSCVLSILCGGFCLFFSEVLASAQGSLFTYQGRLATNGAAANGNFDMQFKLRPASTGTGQVGATLTNAPVAVSNGLFTVTLDFGAAVFNGSPVWLEIGVRTNGSTSAYTILAPTQEITPTPYAIQAATAGAAATATVVTGNIADSQLSTNVPRLNGTDVFGGAVTLSNGMGNFNGTLSGMFTGAFSGNGSGTFNGTNTGTFIGNGAGVTNVNVTNITGIVQSNPNWQLIQGTSQQAVSANNYMATNPAKTTITLPLAPNIGSTFRLSGSGAGGWAIAQNVGQSILTGSLGLPAGKVWAVSTNSTTAAWKTIAASTNGQKMVAAINNGLIYTSVDGGLTWQSHGGAAAWYSLASSADGTHLAAAVDVGNIYISTNSGSNWTGQATGLGNQAWFSVASSADGSKLAAVINNGQIYTSVNGGSNWTPRAFAKAWVSIASSADGTRLAAVANVDNIYLSANSGATWTTNTSLGALAWSAIASSADGVNLVAVVNGGSIYTSHDSGANWTLRATSQAWDAVTCSADGANMLATVNVGLVYSSFDGGQTWTSRTTGNQAWSTVAISPDGTRAAAAVNGGQIYDSISATTVGTSGSLTGSQFSTIELQFIGSGQWMPLGSTGLFVGF